VSDARPVEAFLDASGWRGASLAPLAGDASFRRYLRVAHGRCRGMLMDAPPPKEDVRPFLAIGAWLAERGFSVPRFLSADDRQGLLLLEDLGDAVFSRLLDAGHDPVPLYAAAVDVLALLHRFAPPDFVPRYDDARILEEGRILLDWYLPTLTGKPAAAALYDEYAALWREVLPLTREGGASEVLVHRDYFADNLMWLPERQGVARVGLIDFQDAVIGPAAYDVMSLLQDSRRALTEALTEAMLNRYMDHMAIADRAAFRTAWTVLGAQRNARIVGLWPRLWQRDGKPRYLRFMAQTWRLLEADLGHPALERLRDWFDRTIAPALRYQPLPGQP
jgi:aminoglycoside/choline kinase family phosphotransferase